MKLVMQRVKRASVSIDGQVYNAIQQGLLLLVGVGPKDDQKDLEYAVRKVSQMRIFSDEEDKMNLSVKDIQGEILSISQFTLFAETKKGNRPAFIGAAKPDMASQLYDAFNDQLEKEVPVKRGIFGADMAIELINDGPVTILLDTKNPEVRKHAVWLDCMFFDIELLGDHLVDGNFLIMDNEVIEACVVIIPLKRDGIANLEMDLV